MVSGLNTPTTMAFLAPNDILVLEKNTGQVQRVVDGTIHSTVLDLAVNFASDGATCRIFPAGQRPIAQVQQCRTISLAVLSRTMPI